LAGHLTDKTNIILRWKMRILIKLNYILFLRWHKVSFLIALSFATFAQDNDTKSPTSNFQQPVTKSVLVVPYMPNMHLSDADVDISQGSEMNMMEVRETMRKGLVKELNKNFEETHDVKVAEVSTDFVRRDNKDMEALYHSLMFASDSVYTLKNPKKFAVKDTLPPKKQNKKIKPETSYMNVTVQDEELIPDYAKKYRSDYIIFLNEIDIKTHFEDCMDLALQIYRRDLLVHYSIFDKTGKQVYGDVAVSHFASNSNDVNEIMGQNYPEIASQILRSLEKVSN
jgi:hypothetical protein